MHMHTYSRTSTHAHVLTHTGHHTVLPSAEAGWGDARTSLCKHARARAHAHTHTHVHAPGLRWNAPMAGLLRALPSYCAKAAYTHALNRCSVVCVGRALVCVNVCVCARVCMRACVLERAALVRPHTLGGKGMPAQVRTLQPIHR